jgi:hypothetical protein
VNVKDEIYVNGASVRSLVPTRSPSIVRGRRTKAASLENSRRTGAVHYQLYSMSASLRFSHNLDSISLKSRRTTQSKR